MCKEHACLERLLGRALTPEAFLSEYWDELPLFISHTQRTAARKEVHDVFEDLLTLEEMDPLLVRAKLRDAEVLIYEGGQQVSNYATPYAAFSGGASIIINHVDKLWPSINALCADLGRTNADLMREVGRLNDELVQTHASFR